MFDPCFTGVLCISSYVLLSLVAPALCLTPVLRVFCVSLCLVISCCSGIVFDPCFTGVFVISCCSGIVFDPCFTGVLCISSYVLLSLVAPALCLTPVLRVFCVSLLMSCYLLLLRHCV